MKQCNKCVQLKNFDDFYTNQKGYCKECTKEISRERRLNYKQRNIINIPENSNCYMCKLTKPSFEFYKTNSNANGLSTRCKLCSNKKNKNRRRHGLTKIQFDLMVTNQQNKCAICLNNFSKKYKLCVDHCHITGVVRKLLCNRCNSAIGLLEEKIENLESAIKYIKEFLI